MELTRDNLERYDKYLDFLAESWKFDEDTTEKYKSEAFNKFSEYQKDKEYNIDPRALKNIAFSSLGVTYAKRIIENDFNLEEMNNFADILGREICKELLLSKKIKREDTDKVCDMIKNEVIKSIQRNLYLDRIINNKNGYLNARHSLKYKILKEIK
ncbi:MAG: hypothetical protein RSB41_01900 [Bacilli bacterium]